MTFCQFSELPAELRLEVFRCCPKKDLLNVALVSKQCREEVLPFLWTSLYLKWDRMETMENVKQVKHLLKYTEELEFADEGWKPSLRMEQGYKSFSFYHILKYCDPNKVERFKCQSLVAGGLQLVSQLLPEIAILNLQYVESVCQRWASICSFQYLVVLMLSYCDIVDDAFKDIGDLDILRKLFITRCKYLTGSCLVHINRIASFLTDFEFSQFYTVPANTYELLSDMTNVKTLMLSETKLNDNILMQWKGKFKSISKLFINFTEVTDLGMPAISTLISLQELYLLECNISDLGLQHICKLANLEKLSVRSCAITDIGLLLISKLMKLVLLDISSNNKITDQGMVHIMDLPSLTSLEICYCDSLTNTSLELISKRMLQLEHIDVTSTEFTIDGLNHLLELPHLKDVDYFEESISDEEIEIFLSRLGAKSKN